MTSSAGLYGQSLYDLADKENLTDDLMQEMDAVYQILKENPQYVTLLSEPSIAKKVRLGLIDDAFRGQIQPYLLNFMKVLLEKGMLGEFGSCLKTYRASYNKANGIAEAVVLSAVELSDAELDKLHHKLETISGKKVLIRQKIDKDILGGIRVELDGKLYDGTVKGRLDDLRKRVNNTVI